jgi:hypothetical protein
VAFVQAAPWLHNEHWRDWLQCLRPGVDWAPLTSAFIRRDFTFFYVRYAAFVVQMEQCWRAALSAFALEDLSLAELDVSTYCCAQLVMTGSKIRAHGREKYAAKCYPLQLQVATDRCGKTLSGLVRQRAREMGRPPVQRQSPF